MFFFFIGEVLNIINLHYFPFRGRKGDSTHLPLITTCPGLHISGFGINGINSPRMELKKLKTTQIIKMNFIASNCVMMRLT